MTPEKLSTLQSWGHSGQHRGVVICKLDLKKNYKKNKATATAAISCLRISNNGDLKEM